jgi:AmmeMemoRadiSam system protein B
MAQTMNSRPAAVAGRFYPAGAAALSATVDGYLAAAARREPVPAATWPKALIVPHAGYVYSGDIAASAYARLAPGADTIRRVVLAGPAHRVAFCGIALSTARAFATPLGEVLVDTDATQRLFGLAGVGTLDIAHADEHCLEVQLPFLQRLLSDFTVVPMIVGDADPRDVACVFEALWGGDETVFIISSDLSHYHDYEQARRMDAVASRAIETLDPVGLGSESACGRIPVQAMLLVARAHGLEARTLDLRNSGDTAGSRDSVVGYGAYALG